MAQTRALLTVRETCDRLRVSPATIFRLVRSGALAPVKIGRRTLFPAEEIQALINAGRRPGPQRRAGSAEAPEDGRAEVVIDALRRAGLLSDPTPERRRRAAEYDARHDRAEQQQILAVLRSLSLAPPLSEVILRSRDRGVGAEEASPAAP